MNKKKIVQELDSFKETHINENYINLSFTIVLVRPENAGNIGAIARIMKNFNFEKLIVFNPIESVENVLSHKTEGFAMHGKDILLNSEIIIPDNQEDNFIKFKEFLKKFDLIIATTAKGRHYSNVKRLSIFPENLTFPISEKPLNIAILFGKESRGLTNDEISLADILIRIPTGNEYPTLNLSHACGIILYEIFKKINVINIGRGGHPIILADKEDRKLLYEFIKNIINMIKIRTHKKENVFIAFKNVFERALISKKELSSITGLFSKINSILKNLNLYEE